MTLSLEKAIAEVKYWHERGRYWPDDPATVAEVIIAAVASGELILLADHRLAVALVVEKAAVYSINESRTLALADTDPLAEVQALRAERDSLLKGHRILNVDGSRWQTRAEAAEAALKKLANAVLDESEDRALTDMARAALQPKPAP